MNRLIRQLAHRLRSLFRKPELELELDEEFQYHLDRQIELNLAAGLSPKEARLDALRTIGAIEQNKEACRDSRQVNWIEDFLQDLRFAARTLRRNPAFSIVAILALALGIGANTTMFSVAYGILFRTLPYADADRIAAVYLNYGPRVNEFGTMCFRDYFMWRENNRSFESIALFRSQSVDISGVQSVAPEQVPGSAVTADFFSILGVPPLFGRTFIAGEDKPASTPLAVISEAMWRRRFSANPQVLGQPILVNGSPYTVIGVMPAAFQLPRRETEVWTNLLLNPPTRYGPWFYRAVARLKPGVTLEQAQSELNNIGQLMVSRNPVYQRVRMPVLSLRDAVVGTTLKPAIIALSGAVGLVLLIAVVNVANLLLARATVRQREIALRLSLGAGSGRLMRQLLVESSLLAAVGGALGLALAWAGILALRLSNPGNLPMIDSVRLDLTALAFVTAISMLTGVLFGLAPALALTRGADLNTTIKEGGGRGSAAGGQGRGRAKLRGALVISEIALSLVLLVGAGLLIRSFANLQQVKGGFAANPQQILSVLISPRNDRKYEDPARRMAFYDELLRKARSLPQSDGAVLTDSLPPERQGDADTFQIEGQVLRPNEINPVVSAIRTSAGLFQVLQIPIIQGRDFTDYDHAKSTPVAIVSEALAQKFFPGGKALGKRIRQGDQWMEIVGIAGNVKYMGLTVNTDPAYYMPFAQVGGQRMYLTIRSRGEDASTLGSELRRVVEEIDPGVTVSQVTTMHEAMRSSISRPRFNTGLLSLFAGIAILLAGIGIYGLIAYSVAQRTHEIGVRMALGAGQSDVLWMVLRSGLSMAAAGLVIGLAGAFAATRMLTAMLYGVGTTDAWTFAGASAGIVLVVLLATIVPALHASRISSMVALRYD